MTALISQEAQRLGAVLKHEYERSIGFCRKAVTIYDGTGGTWPVGTVLTKFLASGTGTATAGTNTGNGTMGTVTVGASARIGT